MARKSATILLVALFAAAASSSLAQTTRLLPVIHVAIITDGPSERAAPLRALFLEEMRAVNRGEFDIQVPPELQLEAVTSLEGGAALISQLYPTTYFLVISRGAFSKALGFGDLADSLVALAMFVPVLTMLCVLLLRKQEK